MQLDQLNPRKNIQIVCSQVCRLERGSGAGVTPNEDAAQTLWMLAGSRSNHYSVVQR